VAKGDRHGFDSYTRRIPADENGRLGRGWERGLEAVKGIHQTAGAAGPGRDEIASWIKKRWIARIGNSFFADSKFKEKRSVI